VGAVVVAVTVLVMATGASASTHQRAKKNTSTIPPAAAPALTVQPVISCPTAYANGGNPEPFVAHQLPTLAAARGLSFYSNGVITVLGPAGWTCGALVAGDGGQLLDVYPPGKPDYSQTLPPKGAAVVQVDIDYTGHIPGAQEVCALFPHSAAATAVTSDGESCPSVTGQVTSSLTSDIVKFTDPAGVTGTGTGSGGSLASNGAVVYPQLSFASDDSVNVALLSCTLPKKSANLCSAILGDFVVRNAPAYAGTSSQ
jgi:hypothetical protein